MKRALTRSEKSLMILCGSVMAVLAVLFLLRDQRARKDAAEAKIAALEPQLTAAVAASADIPFWDERRAWLDRVQPKIDEEGAAHSRFLEDLQSSARDRGLSTSSPVLLKPESGKHARDLSVTLQVSGPDNAVFRWIAGLQSPGKLQVIKFLQLTPQSATPPRMNGTLTVARLFQP